MCLYRWFMLLKKEFYKLKKTFLLESENCQEKVNKLFDTPVQKPAVSVPMVSWDPESTKWGTALAWETVQHT